MKIKFLYIENGKITLTRQELEQLLEESYQDGIAEGRKSNNSGGLTYQPGEIKTPDYYNSPYWGIDRAIPVTCNDPNVVKISSSGDPLRWTEAGTITIASDYTANDCVISTYTANDCVYSTRQTSDDNISSSMKTYTNDVNAAKLAETEE